MAQSGNYPIKSIVKLVAKLLLAGMIGSALVSGNLDGMRTLIVIAALIQIVPMIFSLFNQNSSAWIVIAVLIVVCLFASKGWIVFTIGVVVLGLVVIYLPLDDLAYNYGNFCGCMRNKNPKRLTRAISGVVSDACLIGAGACLILSPFIGLFYTLGATLGYIALVAYIVKFVMNVLCEDFRN